MYLIGHALKNIARNKGRYLLIGAVLTISFLAVTLRRKCVFYARFKKAAGAHGA